MLRKILILALVFMSCTLIWSSENRAESVVYTGAQVIIDDGVGGGTFVSYGEKLSDQVVFWLAGYNATKTSSGSNTDNGYIGISVFTDYIIPKIKTGIFLTYNAGASKVDSLKADFGNLGSAGFYVDFTTKTRFQIGGSYYETKGMKNWSIQTGLVMNKPW